MKIVIIWDPHGDLQKIKKIPLKEADLILVTGDLGKANLARKRSFENSKRREKGLPELKIDAKFTKKVYKEIYHSTLKILKFLSKRAPTYSILGNVGIEMIDDSNRERKEKNMELIFPLLKRALKK